MCSGGNKSYSKHSCGLLSAAIITAASLRVVKAEPLIGSARGQRASCAQRGVGRMEGSVRRSDGEMVSCHLTEPNYKTTQHCAHGWGARPPVTGGGRLMMLVWPAERRPTQTSAHYCQHTSRRKTLGAPRDTTLKRYTHTCPKVERLEEKKKKHKSNANHIHLLDQSCDLVHTLSCVIMGHQQVKAECRCRCRRCELTTSTAS